MAARKGASRGINGGYFVIGDADGTPGDLAGASILGGRVVSEAVDGRTDLLLGPAFPSVSALRDAQSVRASDGATRLLDGDNRKPGLVRSCGGSGGDAPTDARSTMSTAPTRASRSATRRCSGRAPNRATGSRRCSTRAVA